MSFLCVCRINGLRVGKTFFSEPVWILARDAVKGLRFLFPLLFITSDVYHSNRSRAHHPLDGDPGPEEPPLATVIRSVLSGLCLGTGVGPLHRGYELVVEGGRWELERGEKP